jgi:hypothetical protein
LAGRTDDGRMSAQRKILIPWLAAALMMAAPMAVSADAVNPISKQPLYADIVKRATRLKARTDRYAAKPAISQLTNRTFNSYSADIRALATLDMQAHYDLIKRGTDRDLKCILMGVSRDLPIKLDAIKAAKTDADLKAAFQNMSDLLDDNAGLITAPATAESGVDCTLEFGKEANALPAS